MAELRLSLSDATFAGRSGEAIRFAMAHGFTHVELTPKLGQDLQEIVKLAAEWGLVEATPQGILKKVRLAFHLSWWGENAYGYWRRHRQLKRRAGAIALRHLLGLVEEQDEIIRFAKQNAIPVLVHGGTVFELQREDKFGMLDGCEVLIENNADRFHPSTPNCIDGMASALGAYDLLTNIGNPSFVLDIPHLAQFREWQGGNFIEDLLEPTLTEIGDRRVAGFHLCDYSPIRPGHLPFGEGILPLRAIVEGIVDYVRRRDLDTYLAIEILPPMLSGAITAVTGLGMKKLMQIAQLAATSFGEWVTSPDVRTWGGP